MEELKYSEIIKKNAVLAESVADCPVYDITVLSNITCHQLGEILSFNLRSHGLNPRLALGNYDNIVQDSYHCSGAKMVIIHYDLVAILDKYADYAENLAENQIAVLTETIHTEIDLMLSNLSSVPVVVFDTFLAEGVYSHAFQFSATCLIAENLNMYLRSRKQSNLQIIDIHTTLMRVGFDNVFDWRMYYLSKSLYSVAFWKEYSFELSSLVYKYTGKLKKAIIFDCDNTLWKGILGEDGENGIDMSVHSKIGQIYHRVQQIAVWLSNHGVLIGLCSKNNDSDVEKILLGHSDMKLRKDHIVVSRVNWKDKASNLKEIAEELNIGLDSLIFVDDSPFEINLIREQLPMVLAFQVPAALHLYPAELLKIVDRYMYLSGNSEDIRKTEQYKAQQEREKAKNEYSSLEDYLASLEIGIEIEKDNVFQIERIAQLTQKTNQFNLTTKRYTEAQIEAFMQSKDWEVYAVTVADKFGDSGLTAVCIVKNESGQVGIDTFLMSCRIMGRNIEKVILDYLVLRYKKQEISSIKATYIPTQKNKPVCDFYENSGFRVLDVENGVKSYELVLAEYTPSDIEYIKIKN